MNTMGLARVWQARLRTFLNTALLAILLISFAPSEVVYAAGITVTTTTDDLIDNGNCTLREAILSANLNQSFDDCHAGSDNNTDTITLASGAVYSLTIPGSDDSSELGDLDVVDNAAAIDLILQVANSGVATISQDASPEDERVFHMLQGTVEGTGITFTGGNEIHGGGILVKAGTLTLTDCVISGNSAEDGGGLYNDGGTVWLEVTTSVAGNTASNHGGGLFNNSGKITTLYQSVIADNAAYRGGGVYVNDGTVNVDDTTISGNTADAAGGGLFNDDAGTLKVSATTVTDNIASLGGGGGIFSDSPALIVLSSRILGNTAGSKGHAIYIDEADPVLTSISHSCIVDNGGTSNGEAAVYNGHNNLEVDDTNWWGAFNGPSPVGFGDSIGGEIEVSGWEKRPIFDCGWSGVQKVKNSSFENDDGDNLPDKWSGNNLVIPPDGQRCAAGECFMKFKGDGTNKSLIQTISLSGNAGDRFIFQASSRAINIPTGPDVYYAQVAIKYTDGTADYVRFSFETGTHDSRTRVQALVANKPYSKLIVTLRYAKSSGEAQFDNVYLRFFP